MVEEVLVLKFVNSTSNTPNNTYTYAYLLYT